MYAQNDLVDEGDQLPCNNMMCMQKIKTKNTSKPAGNTESQHVKSFQRMLIVGDFWNSRIERN